MATPINPQLNSSNFRAAVLLHWERFKKLPGSDAIASKAALLSILSLTLLRPPNKVVEVGAGLGTITEFMLEFTSAQVISTEPVPALFKELKKRESLKFQVVLDETEIDVDKFLPDWVIIDGPCNIEALRRLLLPGSLEVIIVENQRIKTRFQVARALVQQKIRFNYCELDSSTQTGIAAFLTISSEVGRQTRVGRALDMAAFATRLGPRFLNQIFTTRGQNLRIGSNIEHATGVK